jgi:hypothetical protein
VQGFRVGAVEAHDGKICRGIVTDRASRELPAIHERNEHPGRVMDDVTVREDQTIGRENKTRTASSTFARFAGARLTSLMDFNIDD